MSLLDESPITLGRARKLPELTRNGKPPSFTTLLRWVRNGVKGVKLESIRLGGSICTSRPAAIRFVEALTNRDQKASEDIAISSARGRSDDLALKRRAEDARKRLASMGFRS